MAATCPQVTVPPHAGETCTPVPGRAVQRGEEVAEVLRQADRAGGDFERAAEEELPDEEELEQPAGPALAVDGVVEVVGPARARETPRPARSRPCRRRARPARRGSSRSSPAGRPSCHEGRDRDERPDADHHRHVQADRLEQAEPPLQHRPCPLDRAGVASRLRERPADIESNGRRERSANDCA